MNYTKANCSCGKELKIAVAKGFLAPDRCMCKACSQGKKPQPKERLNLSRAQDHNFRAVDRSIRNNYGTKI